MRRVLVFLAVGMLTMTVAAPVQAAQSGTFTLVSQSATYSPRTGDVTFRIVFSTKPDFLTVDELGRPLDEFQYYIVGDAALPYPQQYDSIIRGGEIRFTNGLVTIRNAWPPDESADMTRSGGWGTIRGEVPYTLHGPVLRFSAPLAMLSDHPDRASIDYLLQLTVFGATTDSVEGTITIR